MSRIDDLEMVVDSLADKVESVSDKADYIEDSLSTELEEARDDFEHELRILKDEMKEIRKVLALVDEPDPDKLDKYNTLRRAYNEYQFVKTLVIGND